MTTDKTPATLAVDVLAVMDREAKLARHYRIENGAVKVAEEASADATAARAAVAELIEADIAYNEAMKKRHSRAYLDCAQIKQRRIQQRLADACRRRNKALARVKGESA